MSFRIQSAVFPVAGLGTRFLPATKASPKEMLPIVNKPLIQYAVEEALSAGAERLIFVTSPSKRAIEQHFQTNVELESVLSNSGNKKMLALVQNIIPSSVECVFVQQGAPLGLGHAVLCARAAVGEVPFFVHLADDLIRSDTPCLEQMRQHYARHHSSVLAVEAVPSDQTASYGIVSVKKEPSGAQRIDKIIEKPKPEEAPSNLAVVGRYLLTPAIFEQLEGRDPGAGGEIQLTDGIAGILGHESVHALLFEGTRYDCGSRLGYLKATVEYGLHSEEVGGRFREYLKELTKKMY